MASVIMLIGLLGLAGLQVIGARANNVGKRMAQASLLAQDLVQNMSTIWAYTDSRLTAVNNCVSACTDTNVAAVTQYWDTGRGPSPSVKFDYADCGDATGANNVDQFSGAAGTQTYYEGVQSPTDATLNAAVTYGATQKIFCRYWNVFNIDLGGTGQVQGKLVQVVVRWFEPGLGGYRQVTTSFFKYDPTEFNQ